MASVNIMPATPTPVFATEARRVRADDRSIETDPSVDVSPETRELPETYAAAVEQAGADGESDPLEDIRPDVRPVIEHLDGAKDATEGLEQEEPDQAEISLQANEAYQTLRQPDDELTPVGTI